MLCFSDSLLGLGGLLLKLFDVSSKVEDDSFSFRGDDALGVELDPLKELTRRVSTSKKYGRTPHG
jgi:hypothetical protein